MSAQEYPTELIAPLTRERGEPLLAGLEEKFPGSRAHADATASWALAIAVELGLDRDRCLAIREAARLHDVGRVYLESDLTTRLVEELDPEAARRAEAHAEVGARLTNGAGVPVQAGLWLRHSRERFDGAGVPEGLAGDAIPLPSRVIRTACSFDVALSQMPQGPGARTDPQDAALATLRAAAGTELDPDAVAALSRALGRRSPVDTRQHRA